MDSIPEDIKRAASDACPTFVSSQAVYAVYQDCIEALEKAILAERERCAKIADEWVTMFGSKEIEYISARTYATDAVKDLAAAIRGTSPS